MVFALTWIPALVAYGVPLAVFVYVLVLMTRFVKAHERIGAALDDAARKYQLTRSS